jgi:hypothetical protein
MGFPIFYQGKILFRNGKPAFSIDCCCDGEPPGCQACTPTWGQTMVICFTGIANGSCDQCTRWPEGPGGCESVSNIDPDNCIWYAEGGSVTCGGVWELTMQVFEDPTDSSRCYVEIELYNTAQAMQPDEYIYWQSETFGKGSPPGVMTLNYDAGRSTSSTCDFTNSVATIENPSAPGP